MTDLSRAVSIVHSAAQLKAPGLADGILKTGLLEFAFKEVAAHVKNGSVLVMH